MVRRISITRLCRKAHRRAHRRVLGHRLGRGIGVADRAGVELVDVTHRDRHAALRRAAVA